MSNNPGCPGRALNRLAVAAVLAIAAGATLGVAQAGAAAIEPTGSAPRDALVIVVGWEASGSTPAAPVDKTVDEVKTAVVKGSGLFDEMSRGLFPGWTVSTAIGPFSIVAPGGELCSDEFYKDIGDAADAKARFLGIDPEDFDNTIYYSANPRGVCAVGASLRGGRRVWLTGHVGPPTVLHELGHSLGLRHGNALVCRDASSNLVSLNGNCDVAEYGDFRSAMGNGGESYAAPHQAALGWLPGKVLTILPIAGTYVLPPIEVDAPTLALRVIDTPNILWLEYRQPLGIDSRAGVLVHREITPEDPNTYLLSMVPGLSAEMSVGQTWINPLGRTRVRLDSEGPLGAQLTFLPEPVVFKGVPDVRGQLLAAASGEITSAGYTVGTTSFVLDSSCEFIGEVMTQNPAPGTQAPTGTAVKLTVGKKPTKCTSVG